MLVSESCLLTERPSLEKVSLEGNIQVKHLMGFIDDSDHHFIQNKDRLRDYQVQYEGFSCRSDQNGCYRFFCKDQILSEPIFILISNGIYWSSELDVVSDREFFRLTIKHVPGKDYLLYKFRIVDGEKLVEPLSMTTLGYELPKSRTLFVNMNPKYIDSLVCDLSIVYDEGTMSTMLPTIKLKKAKEIGEISASKSKSQVGVLSKVRLKAKTVLRKWKHSRFHQEQIINQTIRSSNPFKPSSGVLISFVSQ